MPSSQPRLTLARDISFSLLLHVGPRLSRALLFIALGYLAGPLRAGVFSLATTYLIVCTAVMQGLDDLLIRQVARAPNEARRYLAGFLTMRLGLSVILYGALFLVVTRVVHYPAATAEAILVLALSVMPESLAYVAQAVLIGRQHFGWPAVVGLFTSVARLGGGVVVLFSGGGILQIAWIWVGSTWLALALLLTVAVRQVGAPRGGDWCGWHNPLPAIRAATSFFLITVLLTLDSQIDVILLSTMRSESEVGWYFAATTITAGLMMLSLAYWYAVYPVLARLVARSPDSLSRYYSRAMRHISMFILPAAAGIVLLAPQIAGFVFGPLFGQTGVVLRLLGVGLLFAFLSEPSTRALLVRDREESILLVIMASASTNLLLDLLLIPTLGMQGAAIARIISSLTYFSFAFWHVKRTGVSLSAIRELGKPALATLVMVGFVLAISHLPLALTVSLGASVYLGALLLLGGVRKEDLDLLRQVFDHAQARL